MLNRSKPVIRSLCAYLMSCDTHDRTCPNYLPKEYSSQVSKGFEKYFSSYRADKLIRTDGQTDGRTDRRNGLPLCPTGHRPFGAAALPCPALLSLHFFN